MNVLYSLDVIGWVEFYDMHIGTKTITHWHYRETKAIDEHHRLPWEICFFPTEHRHMVIIIMRGTTIAEIIPIRI